MLNKAGSNLLPNSLVSHPGEKFTSLRPMGLGLWQRQWGQQPKEVKGSSSNEHWSAAVNGSPLI